CALLGPYLGVNLTAYCEVSDTGELTIVAEHIVDAGALPRSLPLQQVFSNDHLRELGVGRTVRESDVLVAERRPPERLAARLLGLRAYLAVPLLHNGRLVAVLLAHQNEPREWTDADVTITQEAAERTWTAVGRARAEREVRKGAAALREADSRKDEFLAMLSHELRNPLAPIMNGLYILEHTPPGSEQAGLAQAIMRRQVAQLARLVDDLLDLTRIGRG